MGEILERTVVVKEAKAELAWQKPRWTSLDVLASTNARVARVIGPQLDFWHESYSELAEALGMLPVNPTLLPTLHHDLETAAREARTLGWKEFPDTELAEDLAVEDVIPFGNEAGAVFEGVEAGKKALDEATKPSSVRGVVVGGLFAVFVGWAFKKKLGL